MRKDDSITLGNTALKVLHTPSHASGNLSLLGGREVFAGDTLFEGSIGRTDFLESLELDVKASLKKSICLPDELIVCPPCGSATTIAQEKAGNPFLQ